MKHKKTILILLILVVSISWYFYNGYRKETSFALLFPQEVKTKDIEDNLLLLKKKKYHFLSAKKLKQVLQKREAIVYKTAVIFIDQAPSDDLVVFLRDKKIPATFFVSIEQAILAKKYPDINLGFKPPFPNPQPKIIQSGYISINFDDGYKSVYENALPLLKKENLPATIFIIAKSTIDKNPRYLVPDQIKDMQEEGWEIGSHSVAHEHFSKISFARANYSLSASKSFLQDMGLYIKGFAFPYGEFRFDTFILARRYYDYYRLTNDTSNLSTEKVIDSFGWKNGFSLRWFKSKIAEAKKNNHGAVFTFHEVSDNGRPYSIKISLFKKAVDLIKASGLPVYSNLALMGKPLFLRQENGNGIESQSDYIKRVKLTIKEQKGKLNLLGIRPEVFLYPEGVVTSGLTEAAGQEGFKLGLGGRFGYLTGNINPIVLKSLIVKEGAIKQILSY